MKIDILDIEIFQDPEAFNKAYAQMPAWRKRKVDAMKFQSGKCLSLGVGLLLHQALESMGIQEPDEAAINEFEKPYYKEFPDLHFSLSHSGQKAMCVVSDQPVGCDIERVKERDMDIAERFFHPSEVALLKSLSTDAEKTDMFFRIWTMKESYIKALGTGLSTALDSFAVLPEPVNIQDYTFREIEVEGYKCSICNKTVTTNC